MGVSIIGLSGLQRGIEVAETGVNIDSFSVRYFPQFKDKVNNYQGQVVAFAIPDKLTKTVTCSGEWLSGATGLMAAVFATAQTFANDTSDFTAITNGTGAGGFYMDDATVGQTRDGFRRFDQTYTSDPLVA